MHVSLSFNLRQLARCDGCRRHLDCGELTDQFIRRFVVPGALDRMSFTWERIKELNPKIIFASVKFSEGHPYSDIKVYENVAQCAGGAASTTGFWDGPDPHPMNISSALSAVRDALAGRPDLYVVNEGANTLDFARNIIDMYEPRKRLDSGTWGVSWASGWDTPLAQPSSPLRATVLSASAEWKSRLSAAIGYRSSSWS
jgi:hypothetical protein